MNPHYTSLIRQEEAKIALLKAKIVECERRIELMRSLMNADDLDALLAKSVEPELMAGGQTSPSAPADANVNRSTVAEVGSSRSGHFLEPRRRLTDDVVQILRYVGPEGKTLDELEDYCKLFGLQQDRGALRSMMSSYKTRHGFIDNPRNGFFQLTVKAAQFLDERYPEAQSETPPVGAEGVSNGSTQAAVEGGTESDGLI